MLRAYRDSRRNSLRDGAFEDMFRQQASRLLRSFQLWTLIQHNA